MRARRKRTLAPGNGLILRDGRWPRYAAASHRVNERVLCASVRRRGLSRQCVVFVAGCHIIARAASESRCFQAAF